MSDLLINTRAPCFGRHVKPLVPAAFAVVNTSSSFKEGGLMSARRPVVKIVAESLSQHDEKHVVPTLLSGIRLGRRLSNILY
jgi:hypothetical protein